MKHNYQKGNKITFQEDKLPYTIMATSKRYAVASRNLNKREDAEILHQLVKMSAYASFTEAYEANKENPVYSIIDFKNKIRSTDDLIFGLYDYFNEHDCKCVIDSLERRTLKLSHRNKTELNIKQQN